MNFIEFIKNLHINLIYIIVALIGVVALVGTTIWNRSSAKKDARNARELEKTEATVRKFSEARKEFVAIFDEARERLNSKGSEASAILGQTMERHRVAYEKFRPILEKSKGIKAVRGLDEKWNHYYGGNIPYAKFHTNGFEGVNHKSKDQAARNEAIKRIKAILDFVDQL